MSKDLIGIDSFDVIRASVRLPNDEMMMMKFMFNVAAITWMMSDSRIYGLSTRLQFSGPNVE